MKKNYILSTVHPEPVEGKRYPLPVLFLVFVSALLTGCGTTRQIQVVERVSRDTLYLSNVQYDSIYVFQDHLTDRSRDTVYVKDVQYEYKYKFLRDTVRIVQIDSIPVIREVEVVKTERYVPGIYKWSLAICIALIILIVCFILKKFMV